MMYECIKPTQYVKSHSNDYLNHRGNRYFIITWYAGRVEITKANYERLEQGGMQVK